MKDLTDRQREILQFIIDFKADREYPPTIRDVGREFELSNRAAYEYFMVLEKKGYISREPGIVRGLKIIKYPEVKNAI